MPDSVSTARTLRIDCMFVDGDTRAITLKNPVAKEYMPSTKWDALEQFMQEKNIIIGDRYGGRFGRIKQATVVSKETTTFDLN